ncbi:hypothetical protein [Candidatus Enterococcus clewellii]|uniref:Uncharacterized protein n=1 Tax=Candidatus Enterococcus clewellii TaxID=1834193 RepID=A0A242K8N9_9ENTE|nr:hypothetical protein [Enterococcus sp. 9E7_DIV0242]OTP17439.1 hypothetical protein A5888_001577 [Enterococcus sp. 9E7_DIV0242]
MTTRLEQAQTKLERIKAEQTEVGKQIREESAMIPLGQPNIIGRRDIYKDINRKHAKSFRLLEEQEKQERRIEMLEKVEDFKQENELLKDVHVVGRSGYANVGARTSVNNLDYFRNKLAEMEQANEEAKAYNKTKPAYKKKTLGAEITKLKRKIANLEEMQEKDATKTVSTKTQALIDNEAVKQWNKKPIYYFVKGLRKVALEIDENGEFFISSRYPAWSEEDEKFVAELLAN